MTCGDYRFGVRQPSILFHYMKSPTDFKKEMGPGFKNVSNFSKKVTDIFEARPQAFFLREDVLEGFRGDGDVEVASEVEKRVHFFYIKGSILVEAVFVFMDSEHFADKKIMVSIGPDIDQLVFEADIGFGQNGRLDTLRGSQLDLKLLYFIPVMT